MSYNDRRRFIKLGLASSAALAAGCTDAPKAHTSTTGPDRTKGPLILSTWKHGLAANATAWEVMRTGGTVLDAVEQGVAAVESDLTNRSVGLGGMPDPLGLNGGDGIFMGVQNYNAAALGWEHGSDASDVGITFNTWYNNVLFSRDAWQLYKHARIGKCNHLRTAYVYSTS